MKARKLKRYESVRVVKMLQDEVNDRIAAPWSRQNPIGDPTDLVALEAAIDILREHAQADDK